MAAAAAAAAVGGSCFSATVACGGVRSKHALTLSMACPRALSSIAHVAESPSLALLCQRRRLLPRLSAAVASHEEASAVVVEEEETEEEKVSDEGKAEAEAEAEVAAAEEEEEVAAVKTKLYFGNLPYNCDSAELAGIIQDYATPEMVEVLYDRDSGRSRGFAFVTMSTVEDCEAVIQNLDGSQYGGRTLRVNFSDKPKPKVPLYPESDYKLFVGNLSWSVTSENLNEVFQEYGNVVGARVLYDGDTGRSRGYGFVCYSTKEEMDTALEALNGVELQGRIMRISLALGKKS